MSYQKSQTSRPSTRPQLTLSGGLSIHLPVHDKSFKQLSLGLEHRTNEYRGVEIRVPGAKKEPLIQLIGRKLVQKVCGTTDGDPNTPLEAIIDRILKDVPAVHDTLPITFTDTDIRQDDKVGGRFLMLVPSRSDQEKITEMQQGVTAAILAESGVQIDAPQRRIDMTVASTDSRALNDAALMLERFYRLQLPIHTTLGAATFSPDPRLNRPY